MRCVNGTFFGSSHENDDNRVLSEETKAWKEYGTGYWPSVVINDRTYRGDLVPDSVLNALCSAFSQEPSQCTRFKVETGINEPEGITGNVLIAVVVLLILVNILMILLYRKCTNKDMKEDMQL